MSVTKTYLITAGSIPLLERGLRMQLPETRDSGRPAGPGTGVSSVNRAGRSLNQSGSVVLTHLENAGAAGGLFKGEREKISLMAGGLVAWELLTLVREGKKKALSLRGISASLIAGGGLSNLADRIIRGTVTDYVRFPRLPGLAGKLVFNISDFCIIGGVLLSLLPEGRARKDISA